MNPQNIVGQKTYSDVQVEQYEQDGWNFLATKGGMFNTTDLDMLSDALTLQGIPDITNGNNCALIYNKKHNFGYYVNAKDALYFCNFKVRENNYLNLQELQKTNKVNHISIIPTQPQIKHADKWKDKECNEIKVLQKFSDTFYSSPYKGTITQGDQLNYQFNKFKEMQTPQGKSIFEGQLTKQQLKYEIDYLNQVFNNQDSLFYSEYTEDSIPLANLTQANPIKWAVHIPLYEDEIGDNGNSSCEFRFRVMGDCFFGLIRCYLRIDDVLIRIIDTRIYHEFNKDFILREFSYREEEWGKIIYNLILDKVNKKYKFSPQFLVDPNQSFTIQNFVDVKLRVHDKIYFKKGD